MKELKCIVCNKQPESTWDEKIDNVINQPYAATVFYTHGHYGSTAYDPMSGSWLEITICDECLVKAARAGKVFEAFEVPVPRKKEYEIWNPDDDV